MVVLLYRVCTHIRLGILIWSICVYVCVFVGYVHMIDWGFWKNDFFHICVGVEGTYTC